MLEEATLHHVALSGPSFTVVLSQTPGNRPMKQETDSARRRAAAMKAIIGAALLPPLSSSSNIVALSPGLSGVVMEEL